MKWHSPRPPAAALGVLVLALAGAGCSGNKRVTINGSVSYKGQPVPSGVVKFYGPGDHSAMAYIEGGTFTITDLSPGEVRVTVEPDPSAGKGAGGKAVKIPPRYADPKTSGLVFSITPGTRDLPIRLED